MHIDIAKNYEIRYWRKVKDISYSSRSEVMERMFDYPEDAFVVADIGSGPKGGFFNARQYSVMYAVDPLWTDYDLAGLAEVPEGVTPICSYADSFTLPQPADFIVSFNALDHSGDLDKSILHIMKNIKEGGSFFLHVHMRTQQQLNHGHQMLFTEQDLDKILSPFITVSKRIEQECPLDKKPYLSYIAHIKNQTA